MKRNLKKERTGVTSPLEAVTALAIVVVMLGFFFVGALQLFSSYQTSEADIYATAIEVAESLIRDPGLTESGSPFWENDPQHVKVIGLALPNMVEGYVKVNTSLMEDFVFLTSGPSIYMTDTCFLEGTPVLLANGSYKDIEDIEVGERVLCFDKDSNQLRVGIVTEVYHHESADMYVVVNGCLRVTPNHALLTREGWKRVKDLRVGDILYDGEMVYSLEPVYKRVPTYDLEVEPFHNYIVGSVIVHNVIPVIPPLRIGGIVNMKLFPSNETNYTNFNVNVVSGGGDTHIYYIKKQVSEDNPYPVLDWRKIRALVDEIRYEKAKESLDLDWRYDFLIRISLINGTVIRYPDTDINLNNTEIVARFSRNVVVFTPHELTSEELEGLIHGYLPPLAGSYQLATFEVVIYR